MQVAVLATQAYRVFAVGPELVVPWHPHDLGKAFAECAEHPFDIRGPLAHVTSDDQPVGRRDGLDALGDGPVRRKPDVQVAHREQPGPGTGLPLSARWCRRHDHPRFRGFLEITRVRPTAIWLAPQIRTRQTCRMSASLSTCNGSGRSLIIEVQD